MNRTIANLGNVFQLGFVADDLDAAINFWAGSLGAGPFFTIPRVQDLLLKAEHYGQPSDIRFSATLGYLGDRQIEIIVPEGDAPSIYRDWRLSGRTGLHHVCIEVADLEEARRLSQRNGMPIAQEVAAQGGGGAIYLDMGEKADVRYVEFYEFAPGQSGIFSRMRERARTWDGRDPLREIDWNM